LGIRDDEGKPILPRSRDRAIRLFGDRRGLMHTFSGRLRFNPELSLLPSETRDTASCALGGDRFSRRLCSQRQRSERVAQAHNLVILRSSSQTETTHSTSSDGYSIGATPSGDSSRYLCLGFDVAVVERMRLAAVGGVCKIRDSATSVLNRGV
jgi:hypothetical protein